MPTVTTTGLKTVLKNISGTEMFFPWIGTTGKTLAANATTSFVGDVASQLYMSNIKLTLFERDVLGTAAANYTDKRIAIISTPSTIVTNSSPIPVANPTANITANVASGNAGTGLANGTYQAAYSLRNDFGETAIGNRTANFTIGGGNITKMSFTSLSANATAFNLYITDTGNPTGTLKLYRSNIASNITHLDNANWTDGTLSFANTTVTAPTTNTSNVTSATIKLSGANVATGNLTWGNNSN